METLAGFSFKDVEENRRLLISKAQEGNLEAAAQLSSIHSEADEQQKTEIFNWIIDASENGSLESQAVAIEQMGHLISNAEGDRRDKTHRKFNQNRG